MEQLPNLATLPARQAEAPSAQSAPEKPDGEGGFDRQLEAVARNQHPGREEGRQDSPASRGSDPERAPARETRQGEPVAVQGREKGAEKEAAAQAELSDPRLQKALENLRTSEDPEARFQALLRLLNGGVAPQKLTQLLQAGDGGKGKELLEQLQAQLQARQAQDKAEMGEEMAALLQQMEQALQQHMQSGRRGSPVASTEKSGAEGKGGKAVAFGFVSTHSALAGSLNGTGKTESLQQTNLKAATPWLTGNGASLSGQGQGQGATFQNLAQSLTGQGSSTEASASARENGGFAEALRGERASASSEGREGLASRLDGAQNPSGNNASKARGASSVRLVQGEQSVQRATVQIAKEASDGQRDVRIKLNPPHLGQMRVELQMSDNRVNAIIHLDNRAAAQQLGDQLQSLRQAFQDQNLDLEDVQVEVGSDQGQNPGEEGQDFLAGQDSGNGGPGGGDNSGSEGPEDGGEGISHEVGLASDSLSLFA